MTEQLANSLSFLTTISSESIKYINLFEKYLLAPICDPLEHYVRNALPTNWISKFDAFLSGIHPLSKDLPLMNPFRVLFIIFAYFASILLGIVLVSLLKPGKEGFKPKPLQILHNLLLVLVSAFMMTETLRQWYLNGMKLFGNSILLSAVDLANITCIFYLSKILEFMDTIIMVLKKNHRQISFLHLYHHSSIFAVWWYVIYFAPGGESYYSVIANSFIHVIMYSYYLSTTIGVPLTFIKPYITSLQMLQFITMMIQALYDIIFINTATCNYPRSHMILLAIYMVTMLALFYNFFIQDAKRRKAQRKKTA